MEKTAIPYLSREGGYFEEKKQDGYDDYSCFGGAPLHLLLQLVETDGHAQIRLSFGI